MADRLLNALKPALLITRREVRDQFRDWRILFPIFGLTLFFPALMNLTAEQIVSFVQKYGAPIIAERLIPFLLMIVGFFPISVSLVIALESFVGEKERRSIEPLLCTPLSDMQLYLGKLLAALVPPLIASYLGIGVYLVGVYRQVGWQASPGLLLPIIVLTTVQALVMVSGAVVVSSQTTSVRAANLLASFIVIPMTLLIQLESVIMFWGSYSALWLIIAALVMIAGLLIRSGVAQFNREELLGRELDTLNLGWMWRTFWQAFRQNAGSPWEWFMGVLGFTLRQNRLPLVMTGVLLLVGLGVGISQAAVFPLPPELLNWQSSDFLRGLESLPVHLSAADWLAGKGYPSLAAVAMVWLQNLRAMTIASLFSVFSFGVAGLLILMLPFAIIGYFMANLASAGMPPTLFLAAFVLPHGVLEIPAILVGGAAMLQLGARLAAPAREKTLGEAWLHALADWARLMLGVSLPLFWLAAALEILLTPRIALWVLGG